MTIPAIEWPNGFRGQQSPGARVHAVIKQAQQARTEAALLRWAARHQTTQTRELLAASKSQRLAAIGTLRRARRLTYDRYSPVMAVWRDPVPWSSHGFDALFHYLFAAGLTVASCRFRLSDGILDAALREATDGIDNVIRDIRSLVSTDDVDPQLKGRRSENFCQRLTAIADSLDLIARNNSSDGPLAMRLHDAAHDVRRAWIVAHDSSPPPRRWAPDPTP